MRKLLFAALAALLIQPALAQSWPSKPVRIILPFPPGSLLDNYARLLWQQISDETKQPAVIENRPGGSQIIGMSACAKSPPDGHTLCMVTADGMVYNPFLIRNMSYDPETDFTPVTNLVHIQSLIVAHPGAPFNTFKEMVAYAKANPGRINWGHWGTASIPEITMNWIATQTGTKLTGVPYKGAGLAWPAVLSGETHATYIGVGFAMPFVKGGKVKPIAVVGARGVPELPGVTTLAAEGADSGLNAWFGLVAPSKTPRPVIDQIHAETIKAFRTPKIQEYTKAQVLAPHGDTPAEYAEFLRRERANAARVFKTLGIKPSDAP
jgi:tripartite-type tricarboxylate transporter receptor subunit TctC